MRAVRFHEYGGDDALQGIAMTTLPVSDLLTEFEVLALQAIDFGV